MWWSNASVDYFERLVRIYKNVIAYHLRPIKPDQEVSSQILKVDVNITIKKFMMKNHFTDDTVKE